jgi:hypothetical protein
MKNQFKLLKEEVQKHNNTAMNIIVDLLEDYNNGLSSYFKDREVTRDFMDAIDVSFTINIFKKRFGDNISQNMAIQQLMLDLNTLARSTWYFEREDGKILTGQTLYENSAVYMASIKVKEPVYESRKAEELIEAFEDKTLHYPEIVEVPEPVGFNEVERRISGEENVSTISEMVSLIQFHAMCNSSVLVS